MKSLVVGTRDDVAGFALAGIEGVVCATREEAHHAIARADEDTLVIVSGEFAGQSPRGLLVISLPSSS